MTRVQLPDGCTGLDMANGKKYTAEKPGGQVEVSGRDARFIGTSWYGQSGVMAGSQSLSFGTKKSRWCAPCRRAWNAWSRDCPRCGAATIPEEHQDDIPACETYALIERYRGTILPSGVTCRCPGGPASHKHTEEQTA